jgi:hypothetical protein
VHIERRFGSGSAEGLLDLAKELMAMNPDVLLATFTPGTRALTQVAGSTPIVFTDVADPKRSNDGTPSFGRVCFDAGAPRSSASGGCHPPSLQRLMRSAGETRPT